MAGVHRFFSIHSHGLVRVGAASPRASVGDAAANARETIALARRAAEDGVDVLVFPELNITSYAIDDLHLQSAQQRSPKEESQQEQVEYIPKVPR